GAVASAVLFFVITNFGVWLAFYPHTSGGLLNCFTLAIPFFRMTLASTFVYVAVLFGVYDLASRRIQNTRLAPVLLNK
ncbi:MAG: hypothetical protein HQL18_03000, partial [Candidatus Omnitrophica bacterium]|nr:hypothetical protein [Candidatus Omnitrophota bacterium]